MSGTEADVTFSHILSGYFEADEKEKRFIETCAALSLLKCTLSSESPSGLSNLASGIEKVSEGIRRSLER